VDGQGDGEDDDVDEATGGGESAAV
jgi:hypothetical protein